MYLLCHCLSQRKWNARNRGTRLARFVSDVAQQDCADARDKVYGLHGPVRTLPGTEDLIDADIWVANYTKHRVGVLTDFIRFIDGVEGPKSEFKTQRCDFIVRMAIAMGIQPYRVRELAGANREPSSLEESWYKCLQRKGPLSAYEWEIHTHYHFESCPAWITRAYFLDYFGLYARFRIFCDSMTKSSDSRRSSLRTKLRVAQKQAQDS